MYDVNLIPINNNQFIYLGAYSLYDTDFINKYNIKYAIDLSNEINYKIKDIDYYMKYNYVYDSPIQNILDIIPTCVEFIDESLNTHNNILVNCFAGISRSSSIVLAYLMYYDVKYKNIPANLLRSLNHIKQYRNIVNPNYGFINQLYKYENMLNNKFFH
jgi:protein-tyrosine phosphatase